MGAGANLDEAAIIRAGFKVLDSKGLDGLSLRLVAEQLEVQAPALYWHVENKAELLSRMAATFVDAKGLPDFSGKSWRECLLMLARTRRQALLKHRDAARLCVRARPSTSVTEATHRFVVPLAAAGLSSRVAMTYVSAVFSYTMGWVAYEQSQGKRDYLMQIIDFDEGFEVGLQALVRGLADTHLPARTVNGSEHGY